MFYEKFLIKKDFLIIFFQIDAWNRYSKIYIIVLLNFDL